jgi:hypothetical protein
MMKTKSILIISFLFISLAAFSQIKFGIRAGISSSSLKSDNVTVDNVTLESVSNAKVGFHFGLMAQVKFLGMYLQPELLYASVGGQVRLKDATVNKLVDQKFNRIDIPVMVGRKLGPARIGLGPVFSMVLSSSSELDDFGDYSDKFKKATMGYQIDLGLDIMKIAIDLKYEGSLSKLGDGIKIAGTQHSFDSRPRQFILSIGYLF